MLKAGESELVGCTDNEQHHRECHQARQDGFHAGTPDFLSRTPKPLAILADRPDVLALALPSSGFGSVPG